MVISPVAWVDQRNHKGELWAVFYKRLVSFSVRGREHITTYGGIGDHELELRMQ